MLVLQAGAIDGRLFLWGECPRDEAPATRKRGRKAAPARSPYDAGTVRLEAALEAAALPLADGEDDFGNHAAWLPTVGGKPIPSTPLVAEPPPPGTPAELAAWNVITLRLGPVKALDLLGAAVGRDTLAPGVVVGNTLAFWTAVLRFAGALVARQQFLPGAATAADAAQAVWEPVLLGPDANRLAALAKAMPPACRALADPAAPAPALAASAVLAPVLTALTDQLVRSALVPPTPLVPGEAPAQEARGDF